MEIALILSCIIKTLSNNRFIILNYLSCFSRQTESFWNDLPLSFPQKYVSNKNIEREFVPSFYFSQLFRIAIPDCLRLFLNNREQWSCMTLFFLFLDKEAPIHKSVLLTPDSGEKSNSTSTSFVAFINKTYYRDLLLSGFIASDHIG